MPYLVLAVALLLWSGPTAIASTAVASTPALAQIASGGITSAVDDGVYGDRDDDDDSAEPDDHNHRYGDDNNDDDDSAHAPDDDDGWEVDPYEHSERA